MCHKELEWLILVTLLSALEGCTDPEGGLPTLPVVATTEWSTLRTDEFYRNAICQGDRDRVDALIEEIAVSLQIELVEKVDVSVVEIGMAQAHCESAYGCYKRGSRRVFSSTFALSHELAHAVIHQEFDDPPTFIDEGLAEAFSTPAPRGAGSLPKLITEDFYPRDSTQQHFARWILEQGDGVSWARQLLAGADADDVFGMTLTELEHLYTTTSPDLYMIDDYCEGTEIPRLSEDERLEILHIDCDDPEVRGLLTPGISGVPTARRTLTLDQPGKYTLGVTGDGALTVSVIGCPREGDLIPSMPGSYGHAVYVGMLNGVAGELIPAGETRTLDLLAMRHRVVVSTAAEGLEISLSVRRVPE